MGESLGILRSLMTHALVQPQDIMNPEIMKIDRLAVTKPTQGEHTG